MDILEFMDIHQFTMQLPNKFQLNQESNIFLLKRNIFNTIKSKLLKELHTKEKSLNMNKLLEPKEFHSKESSPIIMPLKLKSNIFQKKLNKLLFNTNQLKEFGKKFNIYQLKLKLFTIQKEITTLLVKVNTSELVLSKNQLLDKSYIIMLIIMSFNQFIMSSNTLMSFNNQFKLSIILITFQFNMDTQSFTEEAEFKEPLLPLAAEFTELHMSVAMFTEPLMPQQVQFILQDKPM